VTVGADQGVRIGHAIDRVHHRRHPLQVDLVHDPVARRDHVHVLERAAGPVDEVEAVLVAPVLDRAVLGKGIAVKAGVFHRQRVIHDQLGGHHRIDLGRIAALACDGIAQPGQVHQRGLAEDVVAHHPRRKPREIQVAPALDQLLQRIVQQRRIAAPDQVLGMHAAGVGQRVPGAGLQRLHRGARVEVIQVGPRQGLAESAVHGLSSINEEG